MWRIIRLFWRFWPILAFIVNFATNKNFFQKSKCAHQSFVPNMTFLGLLSRRISLGEKKQSPAQTAYFAIREPQRAAEKARNFL